MENSFSTLGNAIIVFIYDENSSSTLADATIDFIYDEKFIHDSSLCNAILYLRC
jgi:hypothetical protein